jgi:hypothetical protein
MREVRGHSGTKGGRPGAEIEANASPVAASAATGPSSSWIHYRSPEKEHPRMTIFAILLAALLGGLGKAGAHSYIVYGGGPVGAPQSTPAGGGAQTNIVIGGGPVTAPQSAPVVGGGTGDIVAGGGPTT